MFEPISLLSPHLEILVFLYYCVCNYSNKYEEIFSYGFRFISLFLPIVLPRVQLYQISESCFIYIFFSS